MNRTTFLIDGFKLYHLLNDASWHAKRRGIKWLNIRELCRAYLPHITPRAILEEIYYFSAFAYHRQDKDPRIIERHKRFIECLTATGVVVELGRFKAKDVYCNGCKTKVTHDEEKETDVAITVKLLELFVLNRCDTIVLVTGDTDLIPGHIGSSLAIIHFWKRPNLSLGIKGRDLQPETIFFYGVQDGITLYWL